MKWNLMPKAPSAFLNRFPELSPLIVQLLYNRELKDQKEIDEFFNPDYETDIYDPYLLKGMKKAVKRIMRGIKKKEQIVIYGDYDADGYCAAAILHRTFRELEFDADIYIPDRAKEGYGLNKKAVKKLAEKKTKLIVTVDLGSTNAAEVKLANSLGMDVIITDHHCFNGRIPKALSIVNPWQEGDKYPFKHLAGAGVAYKLACALLSEFEKNNFKKWLLDLVALATIADVMPLLGENRTLVKYGLGVLAQTKWVGLQNLMKIAQVEPRIIQPSIDGEPPSTNLDSYAIGYILAPRLNATSRMGQTYDAFELLTTQDEKRAEALARQINQDNRERQKLTDKIVSELEKRIKEGGRAEPSGLIFEGDADWSGGLIGLVAGKIKDKYNLPTVVFREEEGFIHASCRSVPQLNLVEVLKGAAVLLERFGGHKKAAGFKAKKENLSKIKEFFAKQAEIKLKDLDLTPTLNVDAEMNLDDINWENWNKICDLSPYGQANPEPVFLARNLEVQESRLVGNGEKHLKLELLMFGPESKKVKKIKAIAFNMGDRVKEMAKGCLFDAAFKLTLNEWNGYKGLEMKIVDIKKMADV